MKTANPGKKPSKLRQMFGSRFKAGSYSAFAAAVVIAIAVLANLAVQALPQTATQIDLTAQSPVYPVRPDPAHRRQSGYGCEPVPAGPAGQRG